MTTRRPVTVKFRASRKLAWPATVERGLLDRGPDTHPDLFGPCDASHRRFVIIDETVNRIYGDRIRAQLDRYRIEHNDPLLIPGGEQAKRQAVVETIWAAMEEWGVPRFDEPTLIWGGGSLHDVGGYAAATYRRQVSYIMFATTLLNEVDAMYALKVGVSELYKNRIGNYHPPLAAHADPQFFASLTPAHFREGAAEILKVAVFMHGKLFRTLEAHGARAIRERFQGDDPGTLAIQRYALAAMGPELSNNPYELDPQRASYGAHDISTGMEPDVTHGTAVGLNTLWSTMVSTNRGLTPPRHRDRIVSLATELGLPRWHAALENIDRLSNALDETARHRRGKQRVPGPGKRPGKPVYMNDITRDELVRGLDDMHALAA